MSEPEFPRLHFAVEFDERMAWETERRGYLAGSVVELANGTRHPVYFFDTVRLEQELEGYTKIGRPFVAEQGMIVVNRVTLENMLAAVRCLAAEGFFDRSAGAPPNSGSQP